MSRTTRAGSATTNREQRDYWAREGQHWVEEADRYDAMNRVFGDAMLEIAGLQAGERVLDVGCGNGATTIAAARLVWRGGRVTGVDLSEPMLALARRRADHASVDNVDLVHADAQIHPFERASFDAVISRFGVMFFDEPQAAFANLGGALKSRGRLAVVVWQDLFQSEWIMIPGGAAAAHVGLPDFGPPGAPGPFALADEHRLRGVLEAAGFDDVTIEPVTGPMRIGDDADDALGFITAQPLVRDELLAHKPEDSVAAALDAARAALQPYEGPDGVVMSGGAWLASARA